MEGTSPSAMEVSPPSFMEASPLHHGGHLPLHYGGLFFLFPLYWFSISTHLYGEKTTAAAITTNSHMILTITYMFSAERPPLEPSPFFSTGVKVFALPDPYLSRLPPKPQWFICGWLRINNALFNNDFCNVVQFIPWWEIFD
ncbi:transmembrane protein, putative [Medicago truncatula]|uniref:Transmembrane protein, putative n=1 Tax=Medicago truncatula TaxID=3880 RepID=A0A072U107_MEDTR|nr:transmembrane protein, putative [Medicago truncatula]